MSKQLTVSAAMAILCMAGFALSTTAGDLRPAGLGGLAETPRLFGTYVLG